VLAPLGVDDVETAIGDVTDAAAVERALDGEHLPGPRTRAILATRHLLLSWLRNENQHLQGFRMGGTGLEPVTPSLSSWCSPN
jgi:hypothetical protein